MKTDSEKMTFCFQISIKKKYVVNEDLVFSTYGVKIKTSGCHFSNICQKITICVHNLFFIQRVPKLSPRNVTQQFPISTSMRSNGFFYECNILQRFKFLSYNLIKF
jgi:hypothetical protein